MSPQVQDAPVQELEQEQVLTAERAHSLLEEAMKRPVSQTMISFNEAIEIGRAAKDSQAGLAISTPQAAMKIMAGAELRIGPIASLTNIEIIQGRVSLPGRLISFLLRRGGYDWRKVRLDEDGGEYLLFYKGKPLIDGDGTHARVGFTREDAERAGLTDKRGANKDKPSMYDKYGKSMYFNRSVTRFMRWYAPEVAFGVDVCTPDEIEEFEPVVSSASAATSSQASALKDRLKNAAPTQEKVNS